MCVCACLCMCMCGQWISILYMVVCLQVDLYNAGPDSGSAISGIFIKNVLPQSPAGRTGELKVGCKGTVLLCLWFLYFQAKALIVFALIY